MKRRKGLLFEEIKELYPNQYVGLTDIVYRSDSRVIESATVKYTLDDIPLLPVRVSQVKRISFNSHGRNHKC